MIDPEQLHRGIAVEMEHTDDPRTAERIARDHLDEHPQYYDYHAAMEKRMEKGLTPNPASSNPRYSPSSGKAALLDALRADGFVKTGGGAKYQYWAMEKRAGPGYFVRTGARAVRLVKRSRSEGYEGRKGPLVDWGVDDEVYYGKLKDADAFIEEARAFIAKRMQTLSSVVEHQLEELLPQVRQGMIDDSLLGDFMTGAFMLSPTCEKKYGAQLTELLLAVRRDHEIVGTRQTVAALLQEVTRGFC